MFSMMATIRILFLLLTATCSVSSSKNRDINFKEVLISLFEHLSIKHCSILKDFKPSDTSTVTYVKRFSRIDVGTAVVSRQWFNNTATSQSGTYWNTAVVLHLSDKRKIDGLEEYSHLIPDISFVWVVLVPPGVEAVTNRIHVPIYSQFFIVKPVDDSTFDVYEFYSLQQHRRESLWGVWSKETNLSVTIKESLFRRRQDFNGIALSVLSDGAENLQFRYWHYVRDCYNFTSTLKQAPELDRTKEKVEALLVGMAMDSDSFWKDSVGPLATYSHYLYMKRPSEEKSFWTSYFRPFTTGAWEVLVLFILSICILIPLLKNIVLRLGVQTAKEKFDPVGYGCLTFDTIMGQSGMDVPSMTLSFRIAFFVVVCFSAHLQCLYGGELISYLTTHEYPLPFTDLAGFVQDGTYNITFIEISHVSYVLLNRSGPVVGNYVRAHYEGFPGFDKIAQKICNDRIVIATTDRVITHKDLKWPCQLSKIPVPLLQAHNAFHLRPNSEFTSAFTFKLVWMRESGILSHMNLHDYHPTPTGHERSDLTEVDLPRTAPSLILILPGIASSVCILFLELLLTRYLSHGRGTETPAYNFNL